MDFCCQCFVARNREVGAGPLPDPNSFSNFRFTVPLWLFVSDSQRCQDVSQTIKSVQKYIDINDCESDIKGGGVGLGIVLSGMAPRAAWDNCHP